jgi:hypothetical protein
MSQLTDPDGYLICRHTNIGILHNSGIIYIIRYIACDILMLFLVIANSPIGKWQRALQETYTFVVLTRFVLRHPDGSTLMH